MGEGASSPLCGPGGTGAEWEGAIQAEVWGGGAQSVGLYPRKNHQRPVLALGEGDHPQWGSVGRGVEGREVGSTSLNLAKAFSSMRACTHAPESFSFPLLCSPAHTLIFISNPLSSECQHLMTFNSTPVPSPVPQPRSPATQGHSCLSSLGLSFPLGSWFWIWL